MKQFFLETKMKFYSVNFLVETMIGMESDLKTINIIYQLKDATEDKFGKLSCIPALFVLTKGNNKEVWDMNKISEKFNDIILITLPKPNNDNQGFANIRITTQPEYSTKYCTNYYPKKYEPMSVNVVKRARESIADQQKKEHDEMLDI